MFNALLLILAFCAAVGVFVLLTRHRADVIHARQKLANSSGGEYAAVSIHTARNGCPAAERVRGNRFLVREAPRLPLAECNWSKCQCTYAHHYDRRTGNGDRRRHRESFAGTDRRDSFGRREADLAMADIFAR